MIIFIWLTEVFRHLYGSFEDAVAERFRRQSKF